MLTFISVCAGIGGIDRGFESVGMQCVAQVEIDDYATKILEKHWPNVPRFRDIRRTSTRALPRADIIAGGIPCQPHSLAGKRLGAADERDLWPDFYRLVCNLRPRYAVVENVPGLRTSNDGRHFGRILSDLAAAGYGVEWVSFPASALGAWHKRERVWIVAHTNSERHNGSLAGQPSVDRERHDSPPKQGGWAELYAAIASRQTLANADSAGLERPNGAKLRTQQLSQCCEAAAHAHSTGCQEFNTATESSGARFDTWASAANGNIWAIEPAVGRVAHGISNRSHRLRCLGNAVVPQCAAVVAAAILHHYERTLCDQS